LFVITGSIYLVEDVRVKNLPNIGRLNNHSQQRDSSSQYQEHEDIDPQLLPVFYFPDQFHTANYTCGLIPESGIY
jgi:hypothetical protein